MTSARVLHLLLWDYEMMPDVYFVSASEVCV